MIFCQLNLLLLEIANQPAKIGILAPRNCATHQLSIFTGSLIISAVDR